MKSLLRAVEVSAGRFAQQPNISWATPSTDPSKTGIRNWLIDGTGYSSVSSGPNGEVVLECIGDAWAIANGSDLVANREAALESLLPRERKSYSNRSLSWPLITSYYSAYFAAQSFLRCLGLGSVYLDASEAAFLNSAWNARGATVNTTTGNYGFEVVLGSPIILTLRKLSSGGGAHKQFWSGFERSQSAIHTVLLTSPALNTLSQFQRQTADAEFTRFMELSFVDATAPLKKLSFDWLSKLRNDINYRFGYNAWLMSWHHSAGLISGLELALNRYSESFKTPSDRQRSHSSTHMAFVAARFCALVSEATSALLVP